MIRPVECVGLDFVGFSIDLYDEDGADKGTLHLGLEAGDLEIGAWLHRVAPDHGATRAEVFEVGRGIRLIGRWQSGLWTSCR